MSLLESCVPAGDPRQHLQWGGGLASLFESCVPAGDLQLHHHGGGGLESLLEKGVLGAAVVDKLSHVERPSVSSLRVVYLGDFDIIILG